MKIVSIVKASKVLWGFSVSFILMSANLAAVGIPTSARIEMDSQGNKVAIWQRAGADYSVIEGSVYRTEDSGWSSPVRLSVANQIANSPRLVMNSSGQAIASWLATASNVTNLYAATISLQTSNGWTATSNVSNSVETLRVSDSTGVKLNDSGKAIAMWQTIGFDIQMSTSTLMVNQNVWTASELVTSIGDSANNEVEEVQSAKVRPTLYGQICEVICPSGK